MSDFRIANGVLTEYTGKGGDVVIPDSVTSIGNCAFYGCKKLKSITIPDSVTFIGRSAFANCRSLESIAIPDSVTSIGDCTFEKCTSLESITIPDSVTSIVNSAFYECKKLKSITIPDSVTSICSMAFYECTSLKSITIPSSVTFIGNSAFYKCSSLESITVPDSVPSIGKSAFLWCSSLTTIITKFKLSKKQFGDTEFTKPIYTNDPAMLPNYMKPLAAIGYAENPDDEDTDRKKAHIEYLKENVAKLKKEAVAHPALMYLMLENKCLKPEDVYSFIEAVVGNTELTAALLDYKENKLTAEEKENAKQKAEAREKKVNDFVRSVDAIDELQGKTFVVSGDLTTFSDRDEFRACLEACGATLSETLDKQTAYLITNTPDSGTQKNKKADSLGIRKITEAQFNAMIGRDEDEIKEMNSH